MIIGKIKFSLNGFKYVDLKTKRSQREFNIYFLDIYNVIFLLRGSDPTYMIVFDRVTSLEKEREGY